ADGRDQEQIEPRVPVKKPVQGSLSPFQQEADHKGEESHQEQKQNDNHKSQRRGEIAAEFPFGDGLNVRPTAHGVASFAVSGRVIVRNTSSKRPSSVCNSSIFQPSRTLTSPTLRASSPFLFAPSG